ncbi:MAG TPA: DUF3795 domain-containing protein [Candidatus Saccharimonadales bacterium]|nr:DUF3795 domain-containing protein [Candidatus Saccharimonadales bacterium]
MAIPGGTAYRNVRGQLGYCGIWCGSCVVGNRALQELAEGLGRVVGAYGVKKWGPKELDGEQLDRALGALRGVPVCAGCRKGGGRENCGIRACATARGLADCTACRDTAGCPHAELLEHMRSGSKAAGMCVKTGPGPTRPLLAEWEARLKTSWPCCVLFHGDGPRR